MIDLNPIKNYLKGLEDQIEEQFGSHAGYQQVRAVLEGTAQEVNTRILISDARAVLSGENKPELVATGLVGELQNQFNMSTGLFSQAVEKVQKDLDASIEKKRAILENRASSVITEVPESESLITGRLVAADGVTPVEGAIVVLRGTGSERTAIIATVFTDENGEYAARLDEETLAKAPKKISIRFESKTGEIIAQSKGFSLAKGKARSVDLKVGKEKAGLADKLTRAEDVRKVSAINAMAVLAREESDLKTIHFQTEKSLKNLNAAFEGLKNLFQTGTSQKK